MSDLTFSDFSAWMDQLSLTSSRNSKLRLIADYLSRPQSTEDRGYALALLTGELDLQLVGASKIRGLAKSKTDEALFKISYDYVGDMGETIALIWPDADQITEPLPTLADLINQLKSLTPLERLPFIDRFLDRCRPRERWIFTKLVTGSSLRIGLSARLAKTGLAQWAGKSLEEIEQVWSAFAPPYTLFMEWLEGKVNRPDTSGTLHFHPLLLANSFEEKDLNNKDPNDYWAEWKWDGIRVQWVGSEEAGMKLYTRTGDEISESFPEIVSGTGVDLVADGELLIRSEGLHLEKEKPSDSPVPFQVEDFAVLQKRLGRKSPSPELMQDSPAFLCLYDLLMVDGRDLRTLGLTERRQHLERVYVEKGLQARGFQLSPVLPVDSWEAIDELRSKTRAWNLEGFMLKKKDSEYRSGRPQGYWYKWKRDPLIIDTVMLYGQRGSGKRSSFYSDFTFGVWDGDQLVTVGKAYFGFTDEELTQLDKWVREHTTERYGASVRAVKPELVLEIAFDSLQVSERHQSGVAMRFPRIHRIRWDKPAEEANTLEELKRLLPST
ncbi:MAG: cisplatin damage response ATP-dependent DNA ligase [Verrucomicrobiota bacterium]